MQVWNILHAARWKYRKKVAKNRHLGTIAQLYQAISSQPRHISTIGKKLLSSNISLLPYFHTWCGLNVNLRCMSETCCTWLAENLGRKKSHQKIAIWAPSQNLSGCIFTAKALIDNWKKNLLSSNISSTYPHSGELRPTSSWDRSGSLGHPS